MRLYAITLTLALVGCASSSNQSAAERPEPSIVASVVEQQGATSDTETASEELAAMPVEAAEEVWSQYPRPKTPWRVQNKPSTRRSRCLNSSSGGAKV